MARSVREYDLTTKWRETIAAYLTWYVHVRRVRQSTIDNKERVLKVSAELLPDKFSRITRRQLETTLAMAFPTPHLFNGAVKEWRTFEQWLISRRLRRSRIADKIKKQKEDRSMQGARYNLVWQEGVYQMFPEEERLSHRHYVRLLFWTGIRPQQIYRMSHDHIRLRGQKRPHLIAYQSKAGSYMVPLIHQDAIEAAKYLLLQRPGCLPIYNCLSLRVTAEWKRLHPGSDRISPESFRKTRISLWLEHYPPAHVAKWCGTSEEMIKHFYFLSSPQQGAWPEAANG